MEEQSTTYNPLENLKNNSSWGGAREGAGRQPGGMNEETKEKKEIEKAMKERIMRSVDNLLNSQMTLALGVQMLYKIVKDANGKRQKPELITDQGIIEDYLAGELDSNPDDYYFIATERPDNRALDSLFDRAFGKARQNIGLDGGEDGKPLGVVILPQKNGNTLATDNQTDGGIS